MYSTVKRFSHILIRGDFNIPEIDWINETTVHNIIITVQSTFSWSE